MHCFATCGQQPRRPAPPASCPLSLLKRGVESSQTTQNLNTSRRFSSRLAIPPLGDVEHFFYYGLDWPLSSCTPPTLRMFPYQKLDTAAAIRLIQVFPSPEDDPIICEIQTVNMEASPGLVYHALSYVWGDETTTTEIVLQDSKTKQRYLQPLHRNLWEVLQQIRKQSRAEYEARPRNTAPLLIWTDALCLNQEDDQEKAQQIPRMGTIYSQATIVLVLLGTDQNLQGELKRLRDCGDNVGFYEALDIPVLDASHDNSPCGLATNPYWRRTWIVQEIVLARRPLIMAGDIIMEFSRLERQLMLNDRTRGLLYQAPSTVGWNWLGQIIDLRAAETVDKRMPLWRIVSSLWENQKSRIADGIYGILGLVGNHSDGTSPTDHITVNYDKSVVDIFFDTIFETRAPLNEYPTLMKDLNLILGNDRRNRPLHTHFPLEKYLKGDAISDRHKKLATIASKANDAMRMLHTDPTTRIQSNGNGTSCFSFEAFHIFEKCLSQPETEKITMSHHAAVVGFLLAGYLRVEEFPCDDPGRDKSHWVRGTSPWRCRVHRAQHSITTYRGEWETDFYFSSSTNLVAVCGEHCDSCDVSELLFEMPEIGFYLRIKVEESDSSSWKAGRLSTGFFDPVS